MARLGRFLREHAAAIVDDWCARVSTFDSAQGFSRPALMDHVPHVLSRVADALDPPHPEPASVVADTSIAHALDRLEQGYDLEEIVAEYAELRRCILARWEAEMAPTIPVGQLRVLETALDESMREATVRFAAERSRLLTALDRLSQAAHGSTDVDGLLAQLVGIARDTIPAADTIVILLREADLLRVRGAAGLEEDRAREFAVRIGEGFAGTIAATRAPMLLRDAAADPLMKSDVVRARGLRALYGVPLLRGERLVGVAHMGSLRAPDFSEEDKLLFRTLASRATMLLVEAQLIAAEREARRSTEEALALLDAVFAAAPAALAVLDPDLKFVRVNEALAVLNGVPARDHNGRSVEEVAPDVAGQVEGYLRQVLTTGEPIRNVEIGKAPDRHVLANYYPVVTSDGVVRGLGAVLVEITEQKRLHERLAESMRQRQRLLAIVSHDLRNPLQTILLGCASLLRLVHGDGVDRRFGRTLETIQRSAQQMDRLIHDLLDLAALEGGALSVHPERVNTAGLVEEAFESTLAAAQERRITLSQAVPEDIPPVRSDRSRTLQVLLNLLANATKVTPEGGHIHIGASPAGEEVELFVEDSGPGLDEQELARVFQRYWRGKHAEYPGTGLGLSICKGLVEVQGGRIWAQNRPDGGARFAFTLPVAQGEGG